MAVVTPQRGGGAQRSRPSEEYERTARNVRPNDYAYYTVFQVAWFRYTNLRLKKYDVVGNAKIFQTNAKHFLSRLKI